MEKHTELNLTLKKTTLVDKRVGTSIGVPFSDTRSTPFPFFFSSFSLSLPVAAEIVLHRRVMLFLLLNSARIPSLRASLLVPS